MANGLEHPIPNLDHFGWGLKTETIPEKHLTERRMLEAATNANPRAFQYMPRAAPMNEALKKRWDDYQVECGRGRGSQDLTLIEPFVFNNRRSKWYQQDGGTCFPAGTLIRMEDGSLKRIEEIRPFDRVLTAEGNIGSVANVQGRIINEPIYVVKTWGHARVKMTAEHPVLTRRGYVEAKDLRMDDYVAIPKYMPETSSILVTATHVSVSGSVRRKARAGATTYQHKVIGGYVEVSRVVPDVIDLTHDFGWVCGIYLAEGSSDEKKVVWTFHPEESETHAQKLVDLLTSMFGVNPSKTIQYRNGRRLSGGREKIPKVCKVVVHGIAWASFFESILGNGSKNKRLHGDLSSGPKEFLRGVLDGWMDGDGHHSEKLALKDGVTISKALALDMYSIANSFGLSPTLQSQHPSVSHGVVERQMRYDVVIRNANTPMCVSDEEKTIWKKMQSLEQEEFSGKVYNFEVTGDNSYVADGLGVHNCVWSNTFRVLVMKMIVDVIFKQDPEEYFGTSEYGAMSIAPHAITYGLARQRANMKGADGLYCAPMGDTLTSGEGGLLMCSTPKLREVMAAAGANRDIDYPEPRNLALYRRIGDWHFNDALRPYCGHRVTDMAPITNIDDHKKFSEDMRVAFQCSSIAIRARGRHADGFTIHELDPSNSWPHNMGWAGHNIASTGEWFARLVNLSWLQNQSTTPETHIFTKNWSDELEKYCYNIPFSHLKTWYDRKLVDTLSVGDIDMPDSAPASA